MKPKVTRYSTYYSSRVGIALVVTMILLTGFSAFKGTINSSNISDILWVYSISAAAYFGLNLTRVTAESIFGKKEEPEAPSAVITNTITVVPGSSEEAGEVNADTPSNG